MSYCTVDDLIGLKRDGEAELIQLTDTDGSGAINYAVLEPAIARADAEINGYIMAYLPLAAVPANLVYLACDITRYYLYGDLMTERVEARYKQAVFYLDKVAAGKIPLAPTVLGVAEPTSAANVSFSVQPSVFGRDG